MRPIVHRLMLAAAAGVVLLGATVRPAAAQASETATVARVAPFAAPSSGLGVRAYFLVDSTLMTASQTFDAIVDSHNLTAMGGGGELLGLWKGLFVRGAVSHTSRSGQRAVVFDNQAVQTGVPLKVAVTPLEMGAGWRLDAGASRTTGVYFGGGLLRMHYQETSEFALAGENANSSFTGVQAFGGIDATFAKVFVAGGEVQYRSLRNAIGTGGVSKGFGETDLGGITFRFLIGIRR